MKIQKSNNFLGELLCISKQSECETIFLFDCYLKLVKKNSVTIYLFRDFKGLNYVPNVFFGNFPN